MTGDIVFLMITGQLNEHPRAAMKARDEGDTKYREFLKISLLWSR